MTRYLFRAPAVAFVAATLLIGSSAAAASRPAIRQAAPSSTAQPGATPGSTAAGQAGAVDASRSTHRPTQPTPWLGTWEAAPSGANDLLCSDCTIRNVVHSSIGGREVRIRVSNVFGTAPLTVAHATVALPAAPGSADVAPGTLRQATFGGAASVTIPVGQTALSDPIQLAVPANHDLLVTTYTPGDPTPFTYHPDAQQDSFYNSGADEADATNASAFPQTTESWYLLTGVEVSGTAAKGDVVAFGDSITDGYQSTYNADDRWPNILADRLDALPPRDQMGVLDAGISANRILLDGGSSNGPSGVSRFKRDVLDQPGVKTVIILEGINDIQQTPHQLDANKIIAGLQEMITMAHAQGLRVIGATLTPFEGFSSYTPQEEQTREAVNHWIRTSHAYNAVVDFDAVVRDPADPHRIRPAFDSGDHLHPNDAGYVAMGAAINLADLGASVQPAQTGPVVRSLTPATASAGLIVTINGSGFGATQGAGYVSFSNVGTYWGSPGAAATFHVDSWSNRAISFTVPEPSGPDGTWHVSVGTTATVNVINAAGAVSRTAALSITPTAALADYYDNTGISPDNDQACADLDGDGFSYSAQTLTAAGIDPGGAVNSGGLTYTWPAATSCSPDNIMADAQTIELYGQRGESTLGLLGTATTGPSEGTVLVHYRDGTTSRAVVSFGDWAGAPISGDTQVASLPYRNSQSGTSNQLTVYLVSTQIPVDPAKTVVSVTLPDVGYTAAPSATGMHIFSLALGS